MDIITLVLARKDADDLSNQILDASQATATWDGNPEGRTVVKRNNQTDRGWCHVSGLLPDRESILESTVQVGDKTFRLGDALLDQSVDYVCCAYVVVIYKENTVVEAISTLFPKVGVYFGFNLMGDGEYATSLTFDTKIIKPEIVPRVTVFDLDEIGIDLQSLAIAGGGSAVIDASKIFRNVRQGQNFMLRGSFAGTVVETTPIYCQWDASGRLINMGLSFVADLDAVVRIDYLMSSTNLLCVITPMGG